VWGASDEDAADGYALLVTMMEYARGRRYPIRGVGRRRAWERGCGRDR
jgi:hypothetical protein